MPFDTTPVFISTDSRTYSGSEGDYLDVDHSSALALKNGTISLSFSMTRVIGDYALISKDNSGSGAGGDFTVWIENGAILVKHESTSGTEYLGVPDVVLSAHTTYHFAMSFGRDGLSIWLNGELVAAEPEFKQGIDLNPHSLVIGGSRAWRDSDSAQAHSLFKGDIADVMVFDEQLGDKDMRALAAAVDPSLAMGAAMAADMQDLAPVFQQLHGASDTLLDILSDFGVTHHGHISRSLDMTVRFGQDNKVKGTAGDDGINGGGGNDTVIGNGGDDVLQGSYGNDKLRGGSGNDILDGGHGEDKLWGGAGDDLLISRADAREPEITYDPNRDEGDPLNELTNGKLYPGQPIPGDDRLEGGDGADIFYFQTLINAKERYLEKHTRDDGTINWHGVAGENDKLHDHWVDVLGDDVVMDYSKAQGDRIVIEGHTTQIGSLTYGDANGDGVMDHSVISLYSDQGSNGGAHNDDLLGTITVYGDLVKQSDIEHTAAPAYGIVEGIWDLDEALAPKQTGEDGGNINAPVSSLPSPADLNLPTALNPIFAIAGQYGFDAEERSALVFDHTAATDLENGTVAFSFSSDSLSSHQALFTKDASDYGDGGHMSVYVDNTGGLVVRAQDASDSYYFVTENAVEVGKDYDFALSFGSGGIEIYLNGARIAYSTEVDVNWSKNAEALVFGASGWSNPSGTTDKIHSYFDGQISDVMIFDAQMTADEIFGSEARVDYAYFSETIDDYSFSQGSGGDVIVSRGATDVILDTDTTFADFKNVTIRKSDVQFGSDGKDNIYGGDGADVLLGGNGVDDLRGNDNDDFLIAGAGDDILYGGDGRDILSGGIGDDRLFAGEGADQLFGGDGHDDLYGDTGNDRLYGGLGDDDLFGHAWNDSGTSGKDRAIYDGAFEDFTFESETYYDSNRAQSVTRLHVTDNASGGSDGFYEGHDRLLDIDFLVFSDQTVAFQDLI